MEVQTQKVLITGSRTWNDEETIEKIFKYHQNRFKEGTKFTLIHGGAKGADSLCAKVAKNLGWESKSFTLTNEDWGRDSKAAGPIRNQRMINECQPDFAYAFWDGSSNGTKDCINRIIKYKNSVGSNMKEDLTIVKPKANPTLLDNYFKKS